LTERKFGDYRYEKISQLDSAGTSFYKLPKAFAMQGDTPTSLANFEKSFGSEWLLQRDTKFWQTCDRSTSG
jgi:hypothetical protein